MLLLFVGLSIEAREGRNSKSTVPESLLVRSRAIRIGNPRVGRLDYIRSKQTFAECAFRLLHLTPPTT
jgi:hypothetical protein